MTALRDSTEIEDEATVAEYYDLRQQHTLFSEDLRKVLNHPTYALPFVQAGRLVRIRNGSDDFGWGAIVRHRKMLGPKVVRLSDVSSRNDSHASR